MLAAVIDVAVSEVGCDEVLRYLGHRGQQVDAGLAMRLDAAVARVLELARPRAALRSFEVFERVADAAGIPVVRLAGSALTLAGHDIAAHLAEADAVVVLAVTLGMGVERELQRLSLAGDVLAQVLFDAAATAAVERAADGAEELIVADAATRGMGVTGRFSPGYGDLPLGCQDALLASVDATRRLGLTLTSDKLLVPTKSVTALLGVGARVQRGRQGDCAVCTLRDRCSIRMAGSTCHP